MVKFSIYLNRRIFVMLSIRPVWYVSLQSAFWIATDALFLGADNKDSGQTNLSLRRVHMSEGNFSHAGAHIVQSK